jgi:hypothetical protein
MMADGADDAVACGTAQITRAVSVGPRGAAVADSALLAAVITSPSQSGRPSSRPGSIDGECARSTKSWP